MFWLGFLSVLGNVIMLALYVEMRQRVKWAYEDRAFWLKRYQDETDYSRRLFKKLSELDCGASLGGQSHE